MQAFQDTAIIVAILNIVSMIGNVLATWKMRQAQADQALTNYWKNKADQLEEENRDLSLQIATHNSINQTLRGKVEAYEKLTKSGQRTKN